jgi:hypothetical protein
MSEHARVHLSPAGESRTRMLSSGMERGMKDSYVRLEGMI